jgi:hypothetical protein
MMTRITIALPEDLAEKAGQTAAEKGTSFDDFVRESLERYLRKLELPWSEDPFFAYRKVFEGPVPTDISERHDDYLYGDED